MFLIDYESSSPKGKLDILGIKLFQVILWREIRNNLKIFSLYVLCVQSLGATYLKNYAQKSVSSFVGNLMH